VFHHCGQTQTDASPDHEQKGRGGGGPATARRYWRGAAARSPAQGHQDASSEAQASEEPNEERP